MRVRSCLRRMHDASDREDDQKHRCEMRDVSDGAENGFCQAVSSLVRAVVRANTEANTEQDKEEPEEGE